MARFQRTKFQRTKFQRNTFQRKSFDSKNNPQRQTQQPTYDAPDNTQQSREAANDWLQRTVQAARTIGQQQASSKHKYDTLRDWREYHQQKSLMAYQAKLNAPKRRYTFTSTRPKSRNRGGSRGRSGSSSSGGNQGLKTQRELLKTQAQQERKTAAAQYKHQMSLRKSELKNERELLGMRNAASAAETKAAREFQAAQAEADRANNLRMGRLDARTRLRSAELDANSRMMNSMYNSLSSSFSGGNSYNWRYWN